MSRRWLLGWASAVACLLLLGACSGQNATPPPSTPSPSVEYHIDLPTSGHVTVQTVAGKPTITFPTNLPAGTRVMAEWHWREGPGRAEHWSGVADGVLSKQGSVTVGAVPSACGMRELVMYATLTYFSDFKGPMPPPDPWQSQSVRDVLGKNFENLTGPQSQPFNQGGMLVAKRHFYFLTGDGCIVPTPPEGETFPLVTSLEVLTKSS